MGYKSLRDCLLDLESNNQLVRINEEVDPYLEMAAIHRRVFENKGPAIWYENVKGCSFPAVSNLFGTLDRSRYLFRDTLERVKNIIALKQDPLKAIKNPLQNLLALKAIPVSKRGGPILDCQASVSQLPQIHSWPKDGGPFILLPQVYSEDYDHPGILKSNLGCYRMQMGGNDYNVDKEVGLHYQIHRGIGVHQSKWKQAGKPMKLSVFIGGPPAHTLAAVMPLPEGISELTFAGLVNNRRFRYVKKHGYVISSDADFVITGEVNPGDTKPEGPFGDHLGYYSLKHNFPVMKVNKVYHRKEAIWPFTIVGRPPQEDTQFARLIQELTGNAIKDEIPGLQEVHAVDAAGVHPLLLAIGTERYAPYQEETYPQELLTIANHILGYGQLSLAKYLLIAAKEDNPNLKTSSIKAFFTHILERIDFTRDLHFYTNTTIDTLDYTGDGLNKGSKVVWAARGNKRRNLSDELPADLTFPAGFSNPRIVFPGAMVVSGPSYKNEEEGKKQIEEFAKTAYSTMNDGFPLLVISDDSAFSSLNLTNFLWVAFTRSNPSHDIYGVDSFIDNKHWGCKGSLIIDARVKPHHAPVLETDPETEKKVNYLGAKGGSLHGII
jgi:4-hydroxy-3-polyprenylbenzoate decarboxylase